MGYAWDITIPAGTSEANAVKQDLKVHMGVITKVGCKFPSGCHGLVKVRVTAGGIKPLFPLNSGSWVSGDDEEVAYRYYYPLSGRDTTLKFEGWSPGTRYDHMITIRIEVLPESVASMIPVVDLLTKIARGMRLIR